MPSSTDYLKAYVEVSDRLLVTCKMEVEGKEALEEHFLVLLRALEIAAQTARVPSRRGPHEHSMDD